MSSLGIDDNNRMFMAQGICVIGPKCVQKITNGVGKLKSKSLRLAVSNALKTRSKSRLLFESQQCKLNPPTRDALRSNKQCFRSGDSGSVWTNISIFSYHPALLSMETNRPGNPVIKGEF